MTAAVILVNAAYRHAVLHGLPDSQHRLAQGEVGTTRERQVGGALLSLDALEFSDLGV